MSKNGEIRRIHRVLSPEDRELWDHVTRGVRRVRAKSRSSDSRDEDPPEIAIAAAGTPQVPATPRGPVVSKAHAVREPPPVSIDRRHVRKIKSGRVSIEARLDLHGLRESEAHTALREFLSSAYAKGQRQVLVITGKGSRRSTASFLRAEEAGVLKRSVPRWLSQPELRSIVVSYSMAQARHGGEGALYIVLRSAHRRGRRPGGGTD